MFILLKTSLCVLQAAPRPAVVLSWVGRTDHRIGGVLVKLFSVSRWVQKGRKLSWGTPVHLRSYAQESESVGWRCPEFGGPPMGPLPVTGRAQLALCPCPAAPSRPVICLVSLSSSRYQESPEPLSTAVLTSPPTCAELFCSLIPLLWDPAKWVRPAGEEIPLMLTSQTPEGERTAGRLHSRGLWEFVLLRTGAAFRGGGKHCQPTQLLAVCLAAPAVLPARPY